MVKAYLRHEHAAAFGVIASPDSNIAYDASGKHLLAPALEKVGVWHVRQGACIRSLSPSSSSSGPSLAVTCIAASSPSAPSLFASGYADGSIRIWDFEKGSCETTLNGHKGAVSAIRYGKLGSWLASGSKENDIILWDLVGETGLCRLCGHRGQVTDLVFLDSDKKLVSSSTDKYLRVWDLETQHCMQIVGGHHSEIWSIDVDPKEGYLVTGSADPELRFYTIKSETVERIYPPNGAETSGIDDSTSNSKWEVLKYFGEIQRQSKDRVATVRFNSSGSLLACQVAGKIVEVFRVLDEAESKRKAKRRLHRKKEKKGTTDIGVNDVDASQGNSESRTFEISVPDIFKLFQTIRAGKKICSASFCPVAPKNSLATLALSLNNNMLELHSIETSGTSKTLSIELQGHRSAIRSVTLSSDNSMLMSTSNDSVKFWNPSTGVCLRTVESGYGFCGMIVPQNKYSFIGTKAGAIEIIDIGSGTRVDVVKAHGGSIPSIVAIPNENGFITGSADCDVKFWEYGLKQTPGQSSKQLTVSNVRTMKMDHDVVVVGISPDGQKIAVALLDSTVKVFFVDSLKPAHTLYGHKLPVLCLDISSDGDLIVTGSADKNLMIWGLDFGDRHKAIFAQDSVLAVRFVRNTHYVFSVGKDRLLKYWDADKFELLLTIQGHHADILGLAISSRGDFVVTGSHDRSIRRWDRTEEPFFIEEEKEKRLEEMFDSDRDNAFGNRYVEKEEIPEEGAVALAGKETQETLTATDSIIEALDLADIELKRIAEHDEERSSGKVGELQPNIMMHGLSPSNFVLRALANVQSNDLEPTLLALPFSDALKLLSYLKDWTAYPDKIELVSKVATVLLQTHHHQLISTPSARPLLTNLKDILHERIKGCKDTIGFNLAAMDHMKQLMAMKSDALFQDAKAKLSEIRSRLSKRAESREVPRQEKRRKKKQKKSSDTHAFA